MIDYLKDFVIINEYNYLCEHLNEKQIKNFEIMQNNVCEILTFLKELGIKNITKIILNRPDICFKTKETLIEQFAKIDHNLLIFILNNNIDDLINFNI